MSSAKSREEQETMRAVRAVLAQLPPTVAAQASLFGGKP